MGRYSLNLRPTYGADEPNPGEQFAAGISGAIRQHMLEGQEDSQRRAQGQVLVKETGVGDRLRSIAGKVRGVFSPDAGAQPTPPYVPPSATPPMAGNPRVAVQPNALGGTLPSITTDAAPGPSAMPRVTPNVFGGAVPSFPTPAQHGLAGARPSIASAIQPYQDTDTHGNTWKVDPLYGAKLADQGKGVGDEDKIQSLIDAGMPPAEARARVLNNVVRYDETFGEGRRAGRGSSLTFEQRKKLQDDAIAARMKIADLTRAGRQNSEEYRQALLKLRQHEADLREQGMEERGQRADVQQEVSIGNAIGSTIPKDPIAQATATPEQKAQWDKAGRQRDVHIKNAESGLAARKNAKATPDQARARAQQLSQQGLSREQVRAKMKAEGFRVQ